MTLEWEQVIVAAQDPVALGTWWREALDWVVVDEGPEVYEIRPEAMQIPGLLFVPVPEVKMVKNRLHLDFRPKDQAQEVDRMLSLGASRVDIGQGEQPWVVLADPEGNEFCILPPGETISKTSRIPYQSVEPCGKDRHTGKSEPFQSATLITPTASCCAPQLNAR